MLGLERLAQLGQEAREVGRLGFRLACGGALLEQPSVGLDHVVLASALVALAVEARIGDLGMAVLEWARLEPLGRKDEGLLGQLGPLASSSLV